MTVDFLPDSGAFLLTGTRCGYAFARADDGGLRHLHWGAAISPDDLPALVDRPVEEYASFGSVPRAYLEEIVAWGGRRFDESTIVARFADGTRGLETRYADH